MRSDSRALLVAAVGVGALVATVVGQRAFVVSGRPAPREAVRPRLLRGDASQTHAGCTDSTAYGFAWASLALGAVVSASLGISGSRRARVLARRAFAGGLVGNEGFAREEKNFDPCNFTTEFPELLPWMREAELKHARICMLAYLGLIVPDTGIGLIRDVDVINAHNACIDGPGQGPMWLLAVFIGTLESFRFRDLGLGFERLTLENAGDLNFGKSFLPKSEQGVKDMRLKELKNGRLAMLAFSGAITQAVAWDAYHFPFQPERIDLIPAY